MLYIVVRYDSEREIVKLGVSDSKTEAQEIMRNDFKEWLFQKAEADENQSFENQVAAFTEQGECEIGNDYAWLNDCNHTNFDWRILETDENSSEN